MAERLKGKQIAILATHGFEQSELTEPKRLLEAEGARVSVVSPAKLPVSGTVIEPLPPPDGKNTGSARMWYVLYRWLASSATG